MIRTFLFLVVAHILYASAIKAPYQRGPGNVLEGDYIVHFHEGHGLDKHFVHIGKTLGDAEGLRIHNSLPGYRAVLDDDTVHRLVRSDPGISLDKSFDAHQQLKPHPVRSVEGLHIEQLNASEVQMLDKRDFTGVHVQPCPDNLVMVQAGKKLPPGSRGPVYDMLKEAGLGVRAYVLDSGINLTHDRFRGRAINFRNHGATPYTEPRSTMRDINGHGTHVAGILGAFQWGVAERATLVNVKVLNDTGYANIDLVARAINAVTKEHVSLRKKNNGAWRGSVINLSLSGDNPGAFLEKAIQNAVNEGIPVVAAAGNGVLQPDGETRKGVDARNTWPCAFDEVICVGAVDYNYQAASWSNFGRKVAYVAPGVDIASMSHQSDLALSHQSGTSQATPHVAGILAIFTSWEAMGYDTDSPPLAQVRLEQNFLEGITVGFPSRQLNRFAITGIHHPNKDRYVPYQGAPGSPAKGRTSENIASGNSSVNGAGGGTTNGASSSTAAATASGTVSWSSVIYPNAATFVSGDPTDDPTILPSTAFSSPSITFSSISFSFDPTTSTSVNAAKRTPSSSSSSSSSDNLILRNSAWYG